jgi:hypothetical protein
MKKEVKFLSHQYELAKDPQYKALLRKKQMYLVDFLNTPHRPHAKDLSGISSYDIAVSLIYTQVQSKIRRVFWLG